MNEHDELYAKVKRFLDKNYPCCGVAGCCGEEEEAAEIVRIVVAAGYSKSAAPANIWIDKKGNITIGQEAAK